jgi:hypothetical protein
MSVALLRDKNKAHSLLDDLQSVFWVSLERALNDLQHNYTNFDEIAQCFLEWNPLTNKGGSSKAMFLAEERPIQFVKNPAFSDLMWEFCMVMHGACRWQAKLTGNPTMAGTQPPPEVPDHDMVLQRFREALDRPDDQWSSEPYDNKNQLRPAMEDVEHMAANGLVSSHTTGSQKRSQSSMEASSTWSSKRTRTSASESSTT